MGFGFGRSGRTTRTTGPRVYSRNRGERRGDRAGGYLLVHERGHARVRLGELLGVEALLEAGQAGHPEGLEEGGEVHALRERLPRPHVGLDEAGVHRRLLHVLEGEGAGDGLALAGELEVERAGGGHGRRRGAKGAFGGRRKRRARGCECRSENDTRERVRLASRAQASSSLRIAKRVVESSRGVPRAGRVCEPRRVARSRKSKGRGRSAAANDKRQVSSAGRGERANSSMVVILNRLHTVLVDTRRLPNTRASTRRWQGKTLSSPSPPPRRVPTSIRIILRSSSMTCVWTILTLPRRLLGRDCSTPCTFSQTRTDTVCWPETPRPTTPPPPSSPPA